MLHAMRTTTIGRPARQWVKRLALVALGAFTALFVVYNRSEIPAAWRSMHHARPAMIGLAAAGTVVWLVNLAYLHGASQRAAGLDAHPTELVFPAAGANFLNLVTKSGGMAGLALLLLHGSRRSQPRGSIVAAYLLTTVVLETAFAATLLVALVLVAADGHLTRTEALAGIVFAIYLALRVTVLSLAARSRASVRALYALARRIARAHATAEPDHRAADELFESLSLVRGRPRAALVAFGHGLLVEAIGIAQLWAVMRAVGASGGVATAVVAYSVSVLFAIVGFLPGGLGFVEVSLGAVLVSFGSEGTTAAAVVVLYRVFELWLPVALGATAAHVVRRQAAARA